MSDTLTHSPTRPFHVVMEEQEQVLARLRAEQESAAARLAYMADMERHWPLSVLPPPVKIGLRSHPSVTLPQVSDYLDATLLADAAKALPLVVEMRGQVRIRPSSPKPPTVRVCPHVLAGVPHATIGAELFASRRTHCQPDMLYHYPINLNHVLTCEHTNHDSIHSWALVFWLPLGELPAVRVTVPIKNTPRSGGGVTPPAQYSSVIRHSWGEGEGCYTYFYEVPAR